MYDRGGPEGGRPGDKAVLRAREQFDDAIELLTQTKARIRRGEIEGMRDVQSQMALVIKTLAALSEAEGKIDDLAGKHDGCGGRGMDLAAARSEVRRRLDRLRAAGGSG